jgi:hypothetical protein
MCQRGRKSAGGFVKGENNCAPHNGLTKENRLKGQHQRRKAGDKALMAG